MILVFGGAYQGKLDYVLKTYRLTEKDVYHCDMVPGEADIRQGAPDYTGRLCVIGSKLAEDKLAELFGV